MAVMDSGDRERESSSGGHYFFFSSKSLLHFPTDSFLRSHCLPVSPGALCRISLLHELPFLHYAISISSHLNPFSPPALLLSLLSPAYISSLPLGTLFK